MFTKMMLLMVCWAFSATVLAECVKTPNGKTVCDSGQTTGGYNPNTGKAWKAETNQRGVTTTETSRGGQAATKNGVGVVKTPGGQTCVKTRNNQGCN